MEEKKEKLSLKEKWKDPKYKAAIKLALYGILIIGVILYLNISRAFSSPSGLNDNQNIINEEENNNLLAKIEDQNYEYNINITISHNPNNNENNNDTQSSNNNTTEDQTIITEETPTNENLSEEETNTQELSPEDTIITYHGRRNKDIITVIKNDMDEYYINDDTYYKKINEKYELTNENDLFDTIESRYVNLDNIKEYIKKGQVEHNTNDGTSILTIIQVPINTIIPSHQGLEEISIEILEEESKLTLTINYTELMKLDDETITNYEVKIEYTNIGNIEENTNPTLQ